MQQSLNPEELKRARKRLLDNPDFLMVMTDHMIELKDLLVSANEDKDILAFHAEIKAIENFVENISVKSKD